jgi:hypothetical protein
MHADRTPGESIPSGDARDPPAHQDHRSQPDPPTRKGNDHGHRAGADARGGVQPPDFHGEIIQELERLRDSDTVRVIDALAVPKDPHGEMEVAHLSNLTKDEAVELGSKVGA